MLSQLAAGVISGFLMGIPGVGWIFGTPHAPASQGSSTPDITFVQGDGPAQGFFSWLLGGMQGVPSTTPPGIRGVLGRDDSASSSDRGLHLGQNQNSSGDIGLHLGENLMHGLIGHQNANTGTDAAGNTPSGSSNTGDASALLNWSGDTTAIPLGDGLYGSSPEKGYVYSCILNLRGGGASHTGDWVHGDTWNLNEKLQVQGRVLWDSATFSNVVSAWARPGPVEYRDRGGRSAPGMLHRSADPEYACSTDQKTGLLAD